MDGPVIERGGVVGRIDRGDGEVERYTRRRGPGGGDGKVRGQPADSTHGRAGLEHTLLGSTAEKVLRAAPCAVLCVPMD